MIIMLKVVLLLPGVLGFIALSLWISEADFNSNTLQGVSLQRTTECYHEFNLKDEGGDL
jgi:hypothetical protein